MKKYFELAGLSAALWVALTQSAFADNNGGTLVVPEPGVLPLIGIAAVAAYVVARRKK